MSAEMALRLEKAIASTAGFLACACN